MDFFPSQLRVTCDSQNIRSSGKKSGGRGTKRTLPPLIRAHHCSCDVDNGKEMYLSELAGCSPGNGNLGSEDWTYLVKSCTNPFTFLSRRSLTPKTRPMIRCVRRVRGLSEIMHNGLPDGVQRLQRLETPGEQCRVHLCVTGIYNSAWPSINVDQMEECGQSLHFNAVCLCDSNNNNVCLLFIS